MTRTPLSPDDIKSIAAAIRAQEAERLGQKLPNSTILNTITRSLGLGQDFRAFKATFEPKKPIAEAPKELRATNLLFVFKAVDGDEVFDLTLQEKFEQDYAKSGWIVDFSAGAHGFATWRMWNDRKDLSEHEMYLTANAILDEIKCLAEDQICSLNEHALAWQSFGARKEICVDFIYEDNQQLCRATVDEDEWEVSRGSKLSDEEAMLLFHYDIEIGSEYHARDITVQDVIVGSTFYQET
jgi:hypothetical protein